MNSTPETSRQLDSECINLRQKDIQEKTHIAKHKEQKRRNKKKSKPKQAWHVFQYMAASYSRHITTQRTSRQLDSKGINLTAKINK